MQKNKKLNSKVISHNENPKKLILFLHGVGSEIRDMESLALKFSTLFTEACCICVEAPHPYEDRPIGYQWFSISDRSVPKIQKELINNFPIFSNFLEETVNFYNLDYSDVILVGFSQGGILATWATYYWNLGAVICFSGCAVPRVDHKSINPTPVYFVHGSDDRVISLEMVRNSIELTKDYIKSEFLLIENLGHSINLEGIFKSAEFIRKHWKE